MLNREQITVNENKKNYGKKDMKVTKGEVFRLNSNIKKRSILLQEDFITVWMGFISIILVLIHKLLFNNSFKLVKFPKYENLFELVANILRQDFLISYIVSYLFLATLFTLGYSLLNKGPALNFFKGFTILFLLTSLAYILSSQVLMKQYLEYAFFSLFIGLIIANFFEVPNPLKAALKSEFYVKTGLVIMGSEVIFSNITSFGFYGLAISWIVVPVVIIFMWWLGNRVLKMKSKSMIMVIAVATSVCGVSAAVAAAAATKAKKNDLTFAVGLSMLFTIIMMVTMPWIARTTGMGELIGGAWIGNTVDSTGAVVLAGEALGQQASQVAAMIKMIQNVLIGFISIALAILFSSDKISREVSGENLVEGSNENLNTNKLKEIWTRLPKFILGFLVSSLVFSFILSPNLGVKETSEIIKLLGSFKGWCFALAFTTIGLETNFKEMKVQMEGGKPMTLYLVGQIFSLIISLIMCYLLLSGIIFPVPNITVV